MGRPHIEYIQSQNLTWTGEDCPREFQGCRLKTLARDDISSAYSALLRLPRGWCGTTSGVRQVLELYVLDGGLELAGRSLPRHTYLYWPGDRPLSELASRQGATLVAFADDPADPLTAASMTSEVLALPTGEMSWDVSTYDPKLTHLALARKVLRLAPGGSNRTYLLTGLPQGYPRSGELQIEQHPHAEEMFLIYGDMSSEFGVMTTGAYFYRPAGLWHGLHATEFGFFMLLRAPGTDRIVTQWSEERRPVPRDPPFRPELPPGAPAILRRPHPVRPDY